MRIGLEVISIVLFYYVRYIGIRFLLIFYDDNVVVIVLISILCLKKK